jgi:hypothetical protein
MALSNGDRKKIDTIGSNVATLLERSVQHEKRMDRSDRRAGVIAGAVAAVIAGVGAFLRGD